MAGQATAPRVMTARYAGTCGGCGEAIAAGESINYGGRGLVSHEACPLPAKPVSSGRTSRRGYRGSRYAYTSGGARMTNRYSRCEDAPCCGCCD